MDTANLWVAICSLFVFLMIGGIGLLYAGGSRFKNATSVLVHVLVVCSIGTLLWYGIGFSLTFSPGSSSFIGGYQFFLHRVLPQRLEGFTGEPLLYSVFQLFFCLVATVIPLGAIAERVSLKAILGYAFFFPLFIYYPVAHWVWGPEGWIASLGAVDFAGGLVVHVSSGFSALALVIVLGRRRDFFDLRRPHSTSLIFLGTLLLCCGWLCFNAGSALTLNRVALQAFFNTILALNAAALVWGVLQFLHPPNRLNLLGICYGMVCGLVAITPGAGTMPLDSAVLTGGLASLVSFYGARALRNIFRVDDVHEVFVSHGLAGVLGALLTAVWFREQAFSWTLLKANGVATLVVALYSFFSSFLFAWGMRYLGGFRVSQAMEERGLDLVQHGEVAINLDS